MTPHSISSFYECLESINITVQERQSTLGTLKINEYLPWFVRFRIVVMRDGQSSVFLKKNVK